MAVYDDLRGKTCPARGPFTLKPAATCPPGVSLRPAPGATSPPEVQNNLRARAGCSTRVKLQPSTTQPRAMQAPSSSRTPSVTERARSQADLDRSGTYFRRVAGGPRWFWSVGGIVGRARRPPQGLRTHSLGSTRRARAQAAREACSPNEIWGLPGHVARGAARADNVPELVASWFKLNRRLPGHVFRRSSTQTDTSGEFSPEQLAKVEAVASGVPDYRGGSRSPSRISNS